MKLIYQGTEGIQGLDSVQDEGSFEARLYMSGPVANSEMTQLQAELEKKVELQNIIYSLNIIRIKFKGSVSALSNALSKVDIRNRITSWQLLCADDWIEPIVIIFGIILGIGLLLRQKEELG